MINKKVVLLVGTNENSKKLVITTVCKKYGKIVCGRSITLAIVFFFLIFFFIFQFQQFNCHNSIFLYIFFISGNIIAEIPFSLSRIHHIISLSSLLLFLKISATPLPKFASLLILPNKFEQYPYHK